MFVSLFIFVGMVAFWMFAWLRAIDRDERRQKAHVISELPRMSSVPTATRRRR